MKIKIKSGGVESTVAEFSGGYVQEEISGGSVCRLPTIKSFSRSCWKIKHATLDLVKKRNNFHHRYRHRFLTPLLPHVRLDSKSPSVAKCPTSSDQRLLFSCL